MVTQLPSSAHLCLYAISSLGSSSNIKRSSTPDSDIIMAQDEASQQVHVEPDRNSAHGPGMYLITQSPFLVFILSHLY